MRAELVEARTCLRRPYPVRADSQPEPDVGPPIRGRKDPAVTGKQPPRLRLPKQDVRKLDRRVQISAQRETPQCALDIDEARGGGDPAGRPVRSHDCVRAQLTAAGQLDSRGGLWLAGQADKQ